MAVQYKYDADVAGRIYRLAGYAYIYAYKPKDGRFAGTAASYTDGNGITRYYMEYAQLTGYYIVSQWSGKAMYQTMTDGYYIDLSDGWTEFKQGKGKKISAAEAQRIIDKIITNDIHIVQNNLVCARYANKFTSEQQERIRELQKRVMKRQNALKDEGLIDTDKTVVSFPKGYVELEPYLDALMKGEAVGIATWAALVITAVVIGSLSTAAYFTYKYFADESDKDVKWSDELTNILQSKLTPEEYEQLRSETKGIVTKARLRQATSMIPTLAKAAAVIVGGILLYKFFKTGKE